MNKTIPSSACPEFADRLVDYSDRELAAEQRQVVLDHLAKCPGCRAELTRLDASLAALTEAIQVADGNSMESSVRLAQRTGPAADSRMPQWAGLAAVAIVCLIGGWSWSLTRSGNAPIQQVTQAPVVAEKESAQKLSPQDALWRIAVIEQEARLAASLELLPRGEPYEAQRKKDERLLAKFQSMARSEDIQ
jgi:anti-sigma factor RsiW